VVRGTSISDRRLAKLRLSRMVESKELFTINDMIANGNRLSVEEESNMISDVIEINPEDENWFDKESSNAILNQNISESIQDSFPEIEFDKFQKQTEINFLINKTGVSLKKLIENLLEKRSVNDGKKRKTRDFLGEKIRLKKILPPFIECLPVLNGNFLSNINAIKI
jgi:hypothetical protein